MTLPDSLIESAWTAWHEAGDPRQGMRAALAVALRWRDGESREPGWYWVRWERKDNPPCATEWTGSYWRHLSPIDAEPAVIGPRIEEPHT